MEFWKTQRKFGLAVLTMGLIFGAWCLCGRPASLFGELSAALIVAAGIYKGSNLGEKWLDGKKPSAPAGP